MKKWYENNYRRHLLDMHIDDWDESFLESFSADTYLENLKRARVSCAMLYYQSHVGLCYYPTRSARMHRAFIGKENEMQRLTDMCREAGIRTVGYYSVNYNVWAHDNHPEWRMLMANGKSKRGQMESGESRSFETAGGSRYGLCCPNISGYVDFVCTQIDEMLEYFSPDALFFDMLFWAHPCYCESCRRRWQEETGNDALPTREDYSDPTWLLFLEKRNAWMGEFAKKLSDYVKERNPDITVEHNVSAAAKGFYLGTGMAVNRASEFCGGDLAGGLLEESVSCKLFREISMNQPFEYMFPKCEPSLYRHTLVKTDEHIEAAVFLAAAHRGATMVIDAIDPSGKMNSKSFDSIGKAFGKLIPYEPYLYGNAVADIGVAYGLESKGSYYSINNHVCAVSVIKNMIEAGIATDVISKPRASYEHKMVFASHIWRADGELSEALAEYVKAGGVLYLSGSENPELIRKLAGVKVVGKTPHNTCYFAPKDEYRELFCGFDPDYPLHINGSADLIEIDEARDDVRVMATLTLPYTEPGLPKFASIHSDPPGIRTDRPAVVEATYGRGRVIFSCASFEAEEYIVYQRIIRNLIDKYVGLDTLCVRSSSPTNVETVVHKEEGEFLISNCLLLDSKDKPYMPAFEVRIRSDKAPMRAYQVPCGTPIPFSYDGVNITVNCPEGGIFAMYKIEL